MKLSKGEFMPGISDEKKKFFDQNVFA